MMIRIDEETERLLRAAMASRGYESAEDFVSAMVQRLAGQTPDVSELQAGGDRLVEHLAEAQGVGPILDFRQLKADFWPAGETADVFMSDVRARREFDTPRPLL